MRKAIGTIEKQNSLRGCFGATGAFSGSVARMVSTTLAGTSGHSRSPFGNLRISSAAKANAPCKNGSDGERAAKGEAHLVLLNRGALFKVLADTGWHDTSWAAGDSRKVTRFVFAH